MSRLASLKTEKPLRERRMQFHSYPLEDEKLLIEGCFRDERLVGGYDWEGNTRRPGVVHLFYVRMLLAGWPLTIDEIEADMEVVPREMCRDLEDSVQAVRGISIERGYTREILRRIGSVRGCTHLTHLIVAMGPASLHGYWTHRTMGPMPVPDSVEQFPGYSHLLGSCRIWAPEGPFIREMENRIASHKKGC